MDRDDDFFAEAPLAPPPSTEDEDRWPNWKLALFLAVVGWLAVIGLYCVGAHWW